MTDSYSRFILTFSILLSFNVNILTSQNTRVSQQIINAQNQINKIKYQNFYGENGRVKDFPTTLNGVSIYIDGEDFLPVKIKALNNNLKISGARYDAFNQVMEITSSDDSRITYLDISKDDYEINFISLDKNYETLYFINDQGLKEKSFFVKVSSNLNDKIMLYKREKIKFIEGEEGNLGFDKGRPNKYKRLKDEFYIKRSNQSVLTLLPKNRKDLAALFSNREKQILSYLKKNKLKLSIEEDIIELIHFLNN